MGDMAVDFLSDEQAAGFGRFPHEISAEDLERFCWLDDADLSVVDRRRGLHNRLGFAVQLISVRVVGRFLTDPRDVPWPVVESLASQLGIADASVLKIYAQRGQTRYEHAAEISTVYGYVQFGDRDKHEELRLFLAAQPGRRQRDQGAGTIDVETVPEGRMNALARYGLAGKASALQGLSGQRRGATLLCAVRALTSEVADDLCDALNAIVTELVVRKAARESAAARLKSLPRLSRASLQLAKAAKTLVEVLGNSEYSSAEAAPVLAEQVSLPELRTAVDVVNELVNPDGTEGDTAAEMMRRFATVRSFLPALASAAPFGATVGGTPTLAALTALPDILDGRKKDLGEVDLSVLSLAWQRLATPGEEIDRKAYTVAVMDAVHKALRRRDIFVVGGRRWGDPRARLLTDPAWQATKNETLGLSCSGTVVGAKALRLALGWCHAS